VQLPERAPQAMKLIDEMEDDVDAFVIHAEIAF
jgi:hypothetical protein